MDIEIERPQECYNFQGIRDFFKKRYKSRLRQTGGCNRGRDLHLHRSRSFLSPHNVKANNDLTKDSNNRNRINKITKNEDHEEDVHTKSQKSGNNGNNNFDNNKSWFRTISLKKKQAPFKVSDFDLPKDRASFQKKGKIFLAKTRIFEANHSLGRSSSSIHRTFSTGTRTTTTTANTTRENSFRNNASSVGNRSTRSMNISGSRSNSNNYNKAVFSSLRSFDKSRSDRVIMFSNSSGVLKLPAMEKELECTLEELCYGSVKIIRVCRDVYSSIGQITQEEELLTVNVKPGWKSGTKIAFKGTVTNDEYKADVIFIVVEKPHHLFLRNDDDLETEIEIPLVDALTGCTVTVPLLGGYKMSMATHDDVVYPGFYKVIVGQGLPNQKNTLQRGDLKVKFLVNFPKILTEEQRTHIRGILSRDDF